MPSKIPRLHGLAGTLDRGHLRLPDLHRLEIISVGEDWSSRFHTTPTHELLHVIHGHAEIRYSDHSVRVSPGDTFLISQNTPHRDVHKPDDDYRVLYVFFTWPGCDHLVRGIRPAQLLSAPDSAKLQLRWAVRELEREYDGNHPQAHERMRLLLLEILLSLSRHATQATPKPGNTRQQLTQQRKSSLMAGVRQHLEDHFASKLSLESIATHFRMSPFHLSRTFSREFDMSIVAMLTRIRMEKAQELLRHQKLSVKEVSNLVGIDDSNYFAKVFHRVMGCNPSEIQLQSPKVRTRS